MEADEFLNFADKVGITVSTIKETFASCKPAKDAAADDPSSDVIDFS